MALTLDQIRAQVIAENPEAGMTKNELLDKYGDSWSSGDAANMVLYWERTIAERAQAAGAVDAPAELPPAPVLDTRAASAEQQQADIQSFYQSIQPQIDAIKADPTKANFDILGNLLATAPVNYEEQDIGGIQPRDFDAFSGMGDYDPAAFQLLAEGHQKWQPASSALAWENIGPALAVTGAALGAFSPAILGSLGGTTAGVTGSAAAPFGYAGSTGVGAGMAEAAGLGSTALGAAGPSIANVPNILGQVAQTPTPPTDALIGTAPTGGLEGAATTGGIGGMATAAEGLIPGMSNADLLNLAGTGISGALGYQAAGQAAETQSAAAQQAIDLQREMYQTGRADIEPWRQAGMGALEQLSAGMAPGGALQQTFGMDQFQADPGAAFREEQGRTQLENYLASTGQVQSGAAQKEAMRFGQGLAAQEYGTAYNRYMQEQANQYNRLAGLAGTGQAATQQIGQYGQNLAAGAGNLMTSQGAAQAAGQMGQANVLSGAIGTGLSMYNQQQQQQQNLAQQNQWMDYLRRSA